MPHPDVLSPVLFRNGVRAKNRVALAPMTNQQSHDDGLLADDELLWLARRAEGGFGIVETCAAHVSLDGQGWPGELGIYDDRCIPGLSRLAKVLKDRGPLALVQIFHGGARSPRALLGHAPFSASAIPDDPEDPREATTADIERVIAQFRDAAVRAHRAGFDGIEIHGAHGYLLCQFLSATLNQRKDAWGGAFENRARLIRTITREIRSAVPASFVVGARISPEDFGNAKGMDLDESLALAKGLSDDGIDFLHISLWNAFNNTSKRPQEHPVPLFRSVIPSDLPLAVAGKIWTRADTDALLARGADIVALGRSAICNPDWPLRIADAGWEPKRPPMSEADLVAQGLSPTFVKYMRNWKGFVSA